MLQMEFNHPSLGGPGKTAMLRAMWTMEAWKEGKNISKWARDHSYGILTKNVAAFNPYPKTLPKTKLKTN